MKKKRKKNKNIEPSIEVMCPVKRKKLLSVLFFVGSLSWRRRIRKIPGVPIMFLQQHKYSIERLPEAAVGGAAKQA